MNFVTIGECMVEFAAAEGGLWRRGFAGDTLNTAWAMRALLGDEDSVGFVTTVGFDDTSDAMVDFIAGAGIDTGGVARVRGRTVGLYSIETDAEGERRFSYWRSTSAARGLASDANDLAQRLAGADLVYVSGITAAILEGEGRANLLMALGVAKDKGAKIAYDSNHRPTLWPNVETARAFGQEMAAHADILLPSLEDEVAIFGDATPEDTLARLVGYGATEVVLTDGANPVRIAQGGLQHTVASATQVRPIDTTGAGDSYSGSYLVARLSGLDPVAAATRAQAVARQVIAHRGALAPPEAIRTAYAIAG